MRKLGRSYSDTRRKIQKILMLTGTCDLIVQ